MKVTKDNAVVGLKVVINKDSEFIGQQKEAVYGVIVNSAAHFPVESNYAWVQVEWKDENGKTITCNSYRIGDCNKFDLNVYQESIKTLNTDTVKVGQKVRVIADSAREIGFDHAFNNERHPKDYTGIITKILGAATNYHSEHQWVHLDNAPSAICTMLLELLEDSKDVMPEYVECIGAYGDCVKGTIYCTANDIEENSLTWQEILISCGNLGSYFIPSTKEAFDLQNQPKDDLVGRYLKALVKDPVCIGMNIGEYLLVTRFNSDSANATYDVTRVKDNHTGFGIEASDLPKFEVMPVGFNPKAKESSEFKVGDWVTIIANTNNSVNQVGDVGQITGEFDTINFRVTVKGKPDFSNSTRITDMRLATPSEIYEAQKLERDEYSRKLIEEYEVPYKRTSESWSDGKCYTGLPIVTSVKRSNIVPLKLEKQKSLINLPTI